MAIATDPDTLRRWSVIFGAKTQRASVYPVGDTNRGDGGLYANDAWFVNTSTIQRFSGDWTSSVNGDVVVVFNGNNAGHYYVQNNQSTKILSLANIDLGTSGAQHAALVNNSVSVNATGDVDGAANTITITTHGYTPGHSLVYDTGAETAIGGISNGTVYYVIVVDSNTIKLATSYTNALAGTEIDITTDGSGDQLFHERILMTVYNNGASASENINGNDTSGDGDGDIADGTTLQAVYSFGKEEWRNDIDLDGGGGAYNDDLIKHQFPLEAITSEQFEIGGGTSHDNWNWFNEYSRKKVRTGGWAEKTTVSAVNDLARETGIITLGSLDTDTQVYYQQTSATTTPVDFTFLGSINEAVRIYYDADQNGTADNDYTTYLKLFARKKGKTYVQSEIADIGVTTIQTIVNRFPLAHATDAAITANDAQILGTTPYRKTANLILTGDLSDGNTVTSSYGFNDPDAEWESDEVVAGDTLVVTSGSDLGVYTVNSLTSNTDMTIFGDFEFSGWTATSSAVDYEIHSYYRVADKTTTPGTAAVIEEGDTTAASNVFTDDTNQHFVTLGVAANDILWTQKSGESYGLYKITSVDDANNVTVDDTDQPFTTNTAVDYMILNAGMYLQFKNDLEQTVNATSETTSVTYDDSNGTYGGRPTITLVDDAWNANVGAGTILEITGSTSNDGDYTVYAQETTKIVSLIPSDVLADETDSGVNSTLEVREGWKRTIGSNTYSFNWKLTADSANLSSIYQFAQHQLRQTYDIDFGPGTSRGDITDLLMSFASPTGTTINMYPDDLDENELNNITLQDHSGVNRTFPYTAAGSLVFNTNLSTDTNAKYWLFFTNDDDGDNLGRDYGTKDAIIVKDKDNADIAGTVPQQGGGSSVNFTYDFDGNTQRGSASAGVAAPVTLVCIGLDTAQFVISTATITRATGLTISAVAALERNYLT